MNSPLPDSRHSTLDCRFARHLSLACCAITAALLFAVLPALGAPPLREVIIVFKTHFDIGYTDMASNVVKRYRTTMIDQALDVVDQSRSLPAAQQFVWTIPGWPAAKIAEDWPGQSLQRKQRLDRAFAEGRFAVHALPFSLHTELLEPEDIARSLHFASGLSRAAGLPLPRDAKMTDVPCHSWLLPTLLRHAGVDFLHLGCNSASSSPHVPRLFWWEGPDGSRLLTMYTAENYGTGLTPPADWPFPVWLALIHTGDNHGPPQPDEVRKVLAEAAQKLPGVKVRIGRLSDFSDALLSSTTPEAIPVVRNDMPDTWIHGPMSDPQGASLARNTRPLISTAEALATQLVGWGITPPASRRVVERASEQSLLYGEHTWGGALYWIFKYSENTPFPYGETWKRMRGEGAFARNEASWEEHTAYIKNADSVIAPLLASTLATLASAIPDTDSNHVMVYNPLPWSRSEVVRTPAVSPSVPIEFFATEVPAMGYRTFHPNQIRGERRLRCDQEQGVLENEFLKITIDSRRGVVGSVIDKRSKHELVDNTQRFGFGQFLYERFSSKETKGFVASYTKTRTPWAINEFGKPSLPVEVPYAATSPTNFTVQYKTSTESVLAVMTASESVATQAPVTCTVTLQAGAPWFELEITLHDKSADPWPEAGWICLPIRAPNPQFRIARQVGIMDPTRDIIRGANRHLYAVHSGLTISDQQGRGAAICPLDHPLISLGEPGCWRYSLEYTPDQPVAFVNLFNNQWTTNFRFWNAGRISSRVRIWAVDGDTGTSWISRAMEARHPLLAVASTGEAGRGRVVPSMQPGLQVSRQGVVVTAFGENPDGAGVLLRLWEHEGRAGKAMVQLPAGLAVNSAQPVDLRGTPVGAATSIQSGKLPVNFRAFAPVSFILSRTSGD